MTRTLHQGFLISAFAMSALPCCGQIDKLRSLYEPLASYSATDKAPDHNQVSALVSRNVSKVTIEELQTVVPLGVCRAEIQ